MKVTGWMFLVLLLSQWAGAAERKVVPPFEAKAGFKPVNTIDRAVLAGLRKRGIKPANLCSDAVFVRRVHLDVIGTLPDSSEVVRFLTSRVGNKRARLIDDLLERPEFAEYWSLKWCDLLRVKAEFPINLWPNGVQAYHRWVRDSIRDGLPYDQFAYALLTSSGSNFRVPPVNFYRAVQSRTPTGLARAAALTFMGTRIDAWPEDRQAGLAVFFSRVAHKPTREWKEEIIFSRPGDEAIEGVLPDGTKVTIGPDDDPRVAFADWLVSPSNDWLARCAVNRIWAWLIGRGIVEEPDDFREDNPPSNPALLTLLAKELVLADFDLRHVFRVILNSATYQQSTLPQSDHRQVEELFGRYIPRQLDAEVLIDALCKITGSTEKYMSAIPEPFTFVPEEQRTISLADGSISSPFLEMFGRPARDTGLASERNNRPTSGQRLHLLNSRDVHGRITRSFRLAGLLRTSKYRAAEVIRGLYLTILSRPPTEEELEVAQKYFRSGGLDLKRASDDLAWALINTTEFLYRH